MELFFATVSLFAVTLAASYIYYKKIKQAQSEFEGSKDVVRNITFGFTRQLRRLVSSVEGVKKSAEDASYIASEALKASQEAEKTARESSEASQILSERVDQADKAMESMRKEMRKLASRPVAPAARVEVDAPIPLRQDAVLDQLTQTELEVLMIIEELGEGSVPEIRRRIEKTREHTARLLKKLFDRGFIDRNTSGMPYRYHIRKEIKELIQEQKERMRLAV